MLVMIVVTLALMRNPEISDLATCKLHMSEIYGAIERYRAVHDDNYPPSLDALKDDYMKDPSVLKCPLDKTGSKTTSYEYTPPKGEPDPDQVIVSCRRHRANPKLPVLEVFLKADGSTGFRQDPKLLKEQRKASPNKDKGITETK